jgi:hypothetical protein
MMEQVFNAWSDKVLTALKASDPAWSVVNDSSTWTATYSCGPKSVKVSPAPNLAGIKLQTGSNPPVVIGLVSSPSELASSILVSA